MLSRPSKLIIEATILLSLLSSRGVAQTQPGFGGLDERHPDPRLTLVFGGGGNSAILLTDKAALVIDTKSAQREDFLALVNRTAGQKTLHVINTHYHPDHTGGNARLARGTVYAGAYGAATWKTRNAAEGSPTEWIADSTVLNLGDETAVLLHVGAAHTSNDLVVYLKKRRMLFAGDLVFVGLHPVMDTDGGCDPLRWMTVLEMLQTRFPIDVVVPGHGEPGGASLLETQRAYLMDMKTAAKDAEALPAMRAKYAMHGDIGGISSFDIVLAKMKEALAR